MSNVHLALVRKNPDVKGPARAVLAVLADHADDKGVSFPSWKTIQRESGFRRSAIHGALKSLKEFGLVSWNQRRDVSGDLTINLYFLTLGGSPRDGLGSPSDGLGVVHEMDGGSPLDGRRSINEASTQSISEASLFASDEFQESQKPSSKKKHLQEVAESIFQKYPRKESKEDGIAAILKAMKTHDPKMLLEKVEVFASAIGWQEKRFIPLPATWFNKKRFEDDPEAWKQPTSSQFSQASAPPVNLGRRVAPKTTI